MIRNGYLTKGQLNNYVKQVILLRDIRRKLSSGDVETVKDGLRCLLSNRGVWSSGSSLQGSGLLDTLLNLFLARNDENGQTRYSEVELNNNRLYYADLFMSSCYIRDKDGSQRFLEMVEGLKTRLTEWLETADACKDIDMVASEHQFTVQRVHFYQFALTLVNPEEVSAVPNVEEKFWYENFKFMDDIMKVAQLLSILNNINESWQIFELDKKPIDSSHFLVPYFKVNGGLNSCTSEGSHHVPWWYNKLIKPCPFMMNFQERKELFYKATFGVDINKQDNETSSRYCHFKVYRKSPMMAVTHIDFSKWLTKWRFQFVNELGDGEGPTKEFFTLLGKDIQSYDEYIWLGDPVKDEETGETYSHSSHGLYLSPISSPSELRVIRLFFIGMVIAKAILDRQLLNVHLSTLFYKQMIQTNRGFDLRDLHVIRPHLSSFFIQLMDTIKTIEAIKSKLLTAEERRKSIKQVTVGGGSFEEMGIDFTLPGFPQVEMIPGGSNTMLDHSNVNDYMFQVLNHYMAKESLTKMDLIKKGFEMIFPLSSLELFSPEEMELLLCGENETQWNEVVLKEDLLLDGYTSGSQPIMFLLGLMTSFDDVEQKNFLEFVTSNRKLPPGGFKSLNPPLTISRLNIDNPDESLPSSATCFNRLNLPPYSNFQIAKIKIMQAITDGRSSFHFV